MISLSTTSCNSTLQNTDAVIPRGVYKQ